MQRIAESEACAGRRDVSCGRVEELATAARMLAAAIEGRGPYVNWAAVPQAQRDQLELALAQLRVALNDADLTVAELVQRTASLTP